MSLYVKSHDRQKKKKQTRCDCVRAYDKWKGEKKIFFFILQNAFPYYDRNIMKFDEIRPIYGFSDGLTVGCYQRNGK